MVSNVSIEEITIGIAALEEKIKRCNITIEKFLAEIQKEKENIVELNFLIREEKRNKEKPKYDIPSLENNINRCHKNIDTFNNSIDKEKSSINRFNYMIEVLTEDLTRPTEIIIDVKSGQIIKR